MANLSVRFVPLANNTFTITVGLLMRQINRFFYRILTINKQLTGVLKAVVACHKRIIREIEVFSEKIATFAPYRIKRQMGVCII